MAMTDNVPTAKVSQGNQVEISFRGNICNPIISFIKKFMARTVPLSHSSHSESSVRGRDTTSRNTKPGPCRGT
eukprot:scaffold8889_cov100-Isochrysis_galbana.AAC.5